MITNFAAKARCQWGNISGCKFAYWTRSKTFCFTNLSLGWLLAIGVQCKKMSGKGKGGESGGCGGEGVRGWVGGGVAREIVEGA